jgi:hypothetical protein
MDVVSFMSHYYSFSIHVGEGWEAPIYWNGWMLPGIHCTVISLFLLKYYCLNKQNSQSMLDKGGKPKFAGIDD